MWYHGGRQGRETSRIPSLDLWNTWGDLMKLFGDRKQRAKPPAEVPKRWAERLLEVEHALELVASRARAYERSHGTEIDRVLRTLTTEVDRIDAAISQVRGLATGGARRKGKGSEDPRILEAGTALCGALEDLGRGDAAKLEQIIFELGQALDRGRGGGTAQSDPQDLAPKFQ